MMKYSFGILNLIFWLLSGAVLGIGVYIRTNTMPDSVRDVIPDLESTFKIGADLMIAAGVFMFVVSFLGCYGAFSENKAFLAVYIGIVGLILGLELAATLWVDPKDESFTKRVKQLLVEADKQMDGTSRDLVQSTLKCCGFGDTTCDSFENGIPSLGCVCDQAEDRNSTICKRIVDLDDCSLPIGNPNITMETMIYNISCTQVVLQNLEEGDRLLSQVGIGMIVTQAVILVLAALVFVNLKKESRDMKV